MKRKTGNHRLNASHSDASRAKPKIERLRRQILQAEAKGESETAAQLIEELAWLQLSSLRR